MDNLALVVLSFAAYAVAGAVFYRLEVGVYLVVFLLLNFSTSLFFRSRVIVLGPLILPSPLSGVTLLTITLAIGRRLLLRRPFLHFELGWMVPLLLILLAQVIFAATGYGNGTEVRRLTFTIHSLVAFPLVVLTLHQLDQVRRLLRALAFSYLLYAVVNIVVSWTTGFGYRGLNPGEYTLSAPTTIAALLNLFIPIALGAFLSEADWRWRMLFLTTLLSSVLLSLLTLSRGGILGIGFSLLAWAVLGRRYPSRRLLVGLGIVLLVILLVNSAYNVFGYSVLRFSYERTLEELGRNYLRARQNLYRTAWQTILNHPLTGIGAGYLPSHSLFLSAGLDGGVLYMSIWLILFAVLILRSFRLWRALASDLTWGPVALGLFISIGFAFVRNWLDTMLYAVGYGFVFWLLRGMESVLLQAKEAPRPRALP
jgi:O-antigen ligase